ncbi:MAG TPA: hypothetical protein VFI13_05365 [Gemmatimonadales bacterium]|nr:hypothetical protein [Gemmatimonadales bacterium]
MRRPAYLAAGMVLALGLLALILPARFAGLLAALQVPPMLYVAAALRAGVGVALFLAARSSRATLAFYFLGMVMVAGGIVVPFIGQGLARPILDAWERGGAGVVRGWGGAAILLASFIVWGLRARPSAG